MASDSEIIKALKKIISRYQEKKDSGLLSVKIEGQEHLLKVYFELGMVVGLSLGTLKNEECIELLETCKPVESAFIKGYKTPDYVAVGKEEVNSKLEGLFGSYPVTGGTTTTSNGVPVVNVKPDDILRLETDFINVMGPVGKMVIEGLYQELGYNPGEDMPSPQYSTLIDKLKEAIPQEHQASFTAKYALGLALNKNGQ